jgi:hypothetical protein
LAVKRQKRAAIVTLLSRSQGKTVSRQRYQA